MQAVCGADYRSHPASMIKELNILPVKALIEYNVIVFMNDHWRNKLPVHFTNYFPLVHQVRHIHYNFRNTNDMHIFRVKYEYLKKFPFILFPEAWNNFASAYKNEDNPFKFRSELKRDLILKHIEVACKQYGCVNCLYHIAHDI